MNPVIIDSGVANLASVAAALKRLGVDATVTSDAAVVRAASHVIVPGVGAAAAAMARLEAGQLSDVMRRLTQPVLGICLGMQILFARSQENGGCDCLGVICGDVAPLPARPGQPVPHMGWNQIDIKTSAHDLLRGIAPGSFFYFVHSFAVPVGAYTLASCDYSASFTAVAGQGNFFGCQFHPERSGAVGARLLENFLRL